ncbi:MAG: carboxypeptidase regulatory-like domain-containing protein [Terracidiphilus sp.]
MTFQRITSLPSRQRRFGMTLMALAALLFCLALPSLFAQTDTGNIVGTVTDATGAVIPGAPVTATNTETGQTLTAVSNGAGEFHILAVPRGDYKVVVKVKGFQAQSSAVTVIVTTTQNIIFKLSPSNVSTTLEVTTAAPLINVSDATVGATIQGEQVTDLPLNGRNFTQLALLTPGVTRGVYGDIASGGGSSNMTETIRYNESGSAALSVNGLRPQADNYILDGVDNNDGLVNTILFYPNIDATQEFKVNTSVAPAEYGRAGGAIVVSSTKQGSNEYHGSAFWFYRDKNFDANPNYRFNGASASPAGGFLRQQPGFSIGGPIIKNKLFAFGDYQAYRENIAVSSHYLTVPSTLMRSGNFTELLDAANSGQTTTISTGGNNSITLPDYETQYPRCYPGSFTNYAGKQQPYAGSDTTDVPGAPQGGWIFDPSTCDPAGINPPKQFTGNIIPQGRLNPAAVNYLNAFNAVVPANDPGNRYLNNYLDNQSENNKYNTFDGRIDWNAGASDTAFFRFSYDNSVNAKTSEFTNLPAGGGTGTNPTHARGYDFGYTHTFSQNVVNETRIAYNRDNYGYMPPMFGQYVSKDLGIVNANINTETTGGALIGGWKGNLEYTGDYGLYAVPQNTYEVNDSVGWVHGTHTFKFGGTFIRRQTEFFNPQEGKGYFWIDSGTVDFTGYEVSELLAGGMDNYQIGAQSGYVANISQEDGLFAQDDWRFSRRLTLNLGLRWDLLTHPFEAHNQQSAFDATVGSSTYGQVLEAGKNGVSKSIIDQNYNNFGPRVGFAYDLFGDGKTVVRGGYGMFYYVDHGGGNNQLFEDAPFGGSNSYLATNGYCITFTGQLSTATPMAWDGGYNCNGYTGPTTVAYSATGDTGAPLPARGFPNFNPAAPPAGTSMNAPNRHNNNSMVQEWNLQVERQMGSNNVVNVAYVGTKGSRLSTYYPYNMYQFGTAEQNFPTMGGINYNNYNGISHYDALQVHAEHHANNGLVGTVSYAWSHTLDDSSGAWNGGTSELYYDPMASYGNSAEDTRQIFSSSIVYKLPFGRGQRFDGNVSRPVDWVVGGWQTSLTAQVQSGTPVDLSTGTDVPANRPDLVGSIKYSKGTGGGSGDYWFKPGSFVNPPVVPQSENGQTVYARLGTLGRNQVFGPGYRVVNWSVQKNIRITDKQILELHGDAFNVFNTPAFTNPNSTLTGGNFGQIESVQQYTNREIQLAARFTF